MTRIPRNSTCAIALSAICLAAPAFGQTAGMVDAEAGTASAQGGLEEIVVTAQKRAENIQDIPVAVSAFNPVLMQAAQVKDISNLQGLVPGLVINDSGASPSNPFMSLRGISNQDVEKHLEPGVGLVIDGVPLGFTAGALLDAFDIERIEVLRGPQGTLFGKNSTGGTISVVRTKPDPSAPFSGKVQVEVGSFANREFKGLLYVPLVTDKLAVKLGANVENNKGAFKNIAFGGRDGDRDFEGYSVAVRATPTEELDMTLTYERQDDHSEYVPFLPAMVPYLITLPVPGYLTGENIQCFNPFLAAACTPVFDKQRNESELQKLPDPYFHLNAITFDASYDLGPFKAVAITGYRGIHEGSLSDFDSTRHALFRDERTQRSHQFSQEFRLDSNFGGAFEIIAGAFYYDGGYRTRQRASLDLAGLQPAPGDPFLPPGVAFLNSISSYDAKIDSRSFALFSQAELTFAEKFKLIVGARQTWDRKRVEFTTYSPVVAFVRDFNAGAVSGAKKDSAKFDKFTPKVVLQYNPSREFQAYASYSVGYNTGGFNGRAASVDLLGPFQPEVLDAYEVGFKGEFLDRRLRVNVAAFHNILKNKQEDLLLFIGSAQGSTTLNAAKAKYQGVEVELTLLPIEGWTITSSTSYLDAKYKNYIGDLGQGTRDLSGLKLRRTPRWTQGLISNYSFALGSDTVNLNASLQYISRFETNQLNDPRFSVPPTARINLGAGYKTRLASGFDLGIDLFIKNVTDNTTFAGGNSSNSRGSFLEEVIPVAGRTWGASATVSF